VLIAIAAFAYVVWRIASTEQLPEGFAKSNGRIEATEVDADTKLAGRIVDILVDEGDFVSAGQVVAHMDTETLQAELRQSQAKLLQANSAVESARSTVAQREAREIARLNRVADVPVVRVPLFSEEVSELEGLVRIAKVL